MTSEVLLIKVKTIVSLKKIGFRSKGKRRPLNTIACKWLKYN